MSRLVSTVIALGIVAAACSANETVYEPVAGLECSTEQAWSEQSVILEDAEGLPTPAAAAEAGLARWEGIDGAEVVVTDSIGRLSSLAGVLVVDGRRVVLAFPSPAPAGGWLVRTTIWCDGFAP